MHMELLLASKSPRRKELLEMMGIPFSVCCANAEEPPYSGGPVEEYVMRLAQIKAEATFAAHRDRWVVGADTVVVCDGTILGKPKDDRDAAEYLRLLQGNEHVVYTGVALMGPSSSLVRFDSCHVCFEMMTDAEIDAYIKTGEPMDKAGAYGIQGRGGVYVRSIRGNYYTVVGLPVPLLYSMLKDAGLLDCNGLWKENSTTSSKKN